MKQYSFEKFKERRQAKRNIKLTIAILIVFTIIVIAALYLANNNFRRFVDINILKKEILEENALHLNLDVENLSYVGAFNNKIVTVDSGVLTFYNSNGKEDAKIDVLLSNPISDSKDKFLALADKGGDKVYLINDKAIKWENTVEGEISDVSVNKNGYVCVIVTGTTYESEMIIYDKEGKKLFNFHLANTLAIDCDISSDNKHVAIAEVDYSGISIQSKTKILSTEAAKNGDDSAIIYTYNGDAGDVITRIKYKDNNTIFCQFDTYVLKISNNKNVEKLYETSTATLYTDIGIKSGYVKIEKEESRIFKSDYRLKICGNNGKSEHLYAVDGSVKKLICDENLVAVVSGTTVEFINQNGWLKKRYIGSKEIKNVYISKKIALIVYKDRIDVIDL